MTSYHKQQEDIPALTISCSSGCRAVKYTFGFLNGVGAVCCAVSGYLEHFPSVDISDTDTDNETKPNTAMHLTTYHYARVPTQKITSLVSYQISPYADPGYICCGNPHYTKDYLPFRLLAFLWMSQPDSLRRAAWCEYPTAS